MHALITNIYDIMLGAMHAILFCISFVSSRSKKSAGENKKHTVRIGGCIMYGKSGHTMLTFHGLVGRGFLTCHVSAVC